jgi:hypothetical protein
MSLNISNYHYAIAPVPVALDSFIVRRIIRSDLFFRNPNPYTGRSSLGADKTNFIHDDSDSLGRDRLLQMIVR